MKEKFRLYHNTIASLNQWFNLSEALTEVMGWFIIGFIFAQDAQLPRIAAKIPWGTKLPSRTQRLWRWLKNPKLDPFFLSLTIAEKWLKSFRNQTIYLVIDRTDINNKHWLLFIGLAYRGRTFPLTWQVLSNKGSTCLRQQAALLKAVEPLIDNSCTVVLLGDREFRSTALMNFCKRRSWHFRLRLKSDTWIRANRSWLKLRDLQLQPGERRYFQKVYITRKRRGPFHLACWRSVGKEDPWYIATPEAASARTLFEFKKRFYVEPMFSDFKRRGFDLERTRIQKPERISRLLLVVVMAYLFITEQGLRCIRRGKRRYFEKGRRFYSLLRLGELYFSDRFDGGDCIKFSLPRLC
ncbi:MAG: IS4 family transposase [Nitrospinaceae bacterium]|nr:IS4 family transposase [Nitrospinaceae bacterium]